MIKPILGYVNFKEKEVVPVPFNEISFSTLPQEEYASCKVENCHDWEDVFQAEKISTRAYMEYDFQNDVRENLKKQFVQLVFLSDDEDDIKLYESAYEDRSDRTEMKIFSGTQKEKSVKYYVSSGNKIFISNSVGTQYIDIERKSGQIEFLCLHRVFPALMSVEDYKQIVTDLIRIYRDLAMPENNKKGKVSMAENEVNSYKRGDRFLEQTEQLISYAKKVSEKPECKLEQSIEKIPIQKAKCITSKILYEHCIQGKDRVRSIVHKESYDIYENRMIKKALLIQNAILKQQINLFVQNDNLGEQDSKKEQDVCKELVKNDNLEKMCSWEEQDELKKFLNQYLEIENLKKNTKDKNLIEEKIGIPFKVKEKIACCVEKKKDIEGYLYGIKSGMRDDKSVYPIECVKRCMKIENNKVKTNLSFEKGKTTKLLNILLDLTECKPGEVVFFLKYVNFINENIEKIKEVEILGNRLVSTKSEECGLVYRGGLYFVEVVFGSVYEIRINGIEKGASYADFYQNHILNMCMSSEINKIKNRIWMEECSNDNERFEMIRKYQKKEDPKLQKSYKENLEKTKKQIEDLLNLPFYKEISNSTERIHNTNIFMNKSLYHKIYKVIKTIVPEFNVLDFIGGNQFQVGKLVDLYEVWCYFRIVLLFIEDYGFRLEKVDYCLEQQRKDALYDTENGNSRDNFRNLQKIIANYFQQGKELEGMVVHLSNEKLKLDIDFAYNYNIVLQDIEKEEYDRWKFGSHVSPDITMCINEKYYVFFDAKAKPYARDESLWDKDLFGVSALKYIKRIEEGEGEFSKKLKLGDCKIIGSFILHPEVKIVSENENKKKRFDCYMGYKANDLYNGYPIDLRTEIGKESKDLNRNLADEARFIETIENYRIGSIDMSPSNLSAVHEIPYLNNLFRMIMELLLEKEEEEEEKNFNNIAELRYQRYRCKCWKCGSEHVQSQMQFTKSAYKKYAVLCLDCNEYWLETHCCYSDCVGIHKDFVKHVGNYLQTKEGERWNIICPYCGRSYEKTSPTITINQNNSGMFEPNIPFGLQGIAVEWR